MRLDDSHIHKGMRKTHRRAQGQKYFRRKYWRQWLRYRDICLYPKVFEQWAYQDVAFPIGSDQTISQPYTVAFQTQLLDVRPWR